MITISYVFIDLETTGLDYETDQIIEIAAIKADVELQNNGRVEVNEIHRFHTMVALEPVRELPEFITKLTSITASDLEGAPDEQTALADLADFIGDSVVVAQNAPFDLSFLSRGGIEPEYFFCTRAIAKYFEPELSASLKDVCARHNIKLDGHHRAMNDVLATIEVFRHFYAGIIDSEIELDNVVLDSPDRPLRFVPKNATVRKVYNVALTLDEIESIQFVLSGYYYHPLNDRVTAIYERIKGAVE